MVRGKTEDAGGLSPVKDNNEAVRHFIRRTLPILGCAGYRTAGKDPSQAAFALVNTASKQYRGRIKL